jgi:tetratricopeptide (TPR) repeat protein
MWRFVRHRAVLGLILVGCTLAGAQVIASQVRPSNAAALLRQGRSALAQGEWDRANQLADRLDELGHRAEKSFLRGEMLLRTARQRLAANPDEARTILRLALHELTQIRQGPPPDEVAVLAAECLVRLEELRLAVSALQTVVREHPEHCEAHRWLAAIYIDLNAPGDAIRHLEAWGQLDSSTGRPYRWIGFFHKSYNRAGPAVEAYRTALQRQLDPSLRQEVIKELAETLLEEQGDYQAALEVLSGSPEAYRKQPELLTLRAECLWALRLRAKMHLAEGQTTAARPVLEAVLRRDAHDFAARQLLMQVYARGEGNPDEAERQRQLLEESRGILAQLTDYHHEARNKPWDAAVRWRIVELCQKLNRTAEAQMWARAAQACAFRAAAAANGSSSVPTGRYP